MFKPTPGAKPQVEPVPDLTGYQQCLDCGASSGPRETLEHNKTCKPGEADYWLEFYERAAMEEELAERGYEEVPQEMSRLADHPGRLCEGR